jgi:hypothetical protein
LGKPDALHDVREVTRALATGVAVRFPGYTLKAFQEEGEVYLAYSAEALVDALNAESPAEPPAFTLDAVKELSSDTVLTNARERAACNGRCVDAGTHQCTVVGDELKKWVDMIDAHVPDMWIVPGGVELKPFDPAKAGIVATIWTEYA